MQQAAIPDIDIAFESHTLSNGMQVIAHSDATHPVVAVHLMYHVGSSHERPGRTGLAHLLEHLMFEGSAHVPKGAFDDLLERAGGSNNGSTWLDRTNYYETVPSHAVELALWLERDRMAHFDPVLDDAMLELQRSVVINERLQHYENRPYGLADERLSQLLFGGDHPYSWPTIGYVADLEATTLDDARQFYRTHYTPGNAVLVLAGDLATDRAFALAERYFGDVPGGGSPAPSSPSEPGVPGTLELPDSVTFPRIYTGYATPAYGTPEWTALDALAYLLADGESSRLQRSIVREQRLAQDVDTHLYPTERHGVFGTVATARSGVSPEELDAAIEREIARVAETPPSEREIVAAVRRVRRDHVAEVATVEGRAESLAYAATVLGGAHRLAEVLGSYGDLTPSDVSRAAAEHLHPSRRASVVVVPNGEEPGDEE